jgi:hypothetical protein
VFCNSKPIRIAVIESHQMRADIWIENDEGGCRACCFVWLGVGDIQSQGELSCKSHLVLEFNAVEINFVAEVASLMNMNDGP